ncbi:type II toxin-antitoxin system HicB family antitoxin [Furfurilactobacillus milii]|uniref:HicB-like antitoxin of toxin-antitoxin system domain-containing protein n=1 Tax=Furfurilactobacillus milii TaxID=2888272 RepID=A0A6N9I2K2_9LACO|nr:type II toxin-antitoxin system HicB family antitoxin [Furfurilactobacillus milii]MYV17195.1 hypothetical protein [Furfurilactobacillus milii]
MSKDEVFYPAIFHHQEDGAFTVKVPDLKGAVTYGDDMMTAFHSAQDVIGGYLFSEKHYPEPTDVAEIPLVPGDQLVIVPLDLNEYRSREQQTKKVKVTVTIPEGLRDEARERHIVLSHVLTEGLRRELAND